MQLFRMNRKSTKHKYKQQQVWGVMMLVAFFAPCLHEVNAGVLVDFPTGAVNSDDYSGVFDENPNLQSAANLLGFTFDHVLAVQPSGGTTEYALRRGGNFTLEPTDFISIELGFGVGDNFISAGDLPNLPGLDFDAPLPGAPARAQSLDAASSNRNGIVIVSAHHRQ